VHRVEAQASLGEGGPEGLACQVELDAAGPEERMESVPVSTLGYGRLYGISISLAKIESYINVCLSLAEDTDDVLYVATVLTLV